MITTITPEGWREVDRIRDWWIGIQTNRTDEEAAERAIETIWKDMGHEKPRIERAPSPMGAMELAARLTGSQGIKDLPFYNSSWWQAWAGWYEGAKAIGVEFNKEKYEKLRNWCLHCTFVVPYDELCVYSDRPVSIKWDDSQLHCEDGPAILYSDGWSVWSIRGVRVNEQIVMRPETQTIQQINSEKNEEVRRIRIDRFGWMRYLEESESVVIDCGRNDIEATYEILANTPVGQRLITHCPSTGRRYSLAIAGEAVTTREEAQRRLWGDKELFIVGRT